MSKKLKLDPRVAYVLGLYSYNKGAKAIIGVVSKSNDVVARFIKTCMDEFGVEPNKITIEDAEDGHKVYFYNTKLAKLFDKTLERKEIIFKYKNAYSGSYLAGIFDVKGGRDSHGIFIRDVTPSDVILIERLGFHTEKKFGQMHIINGVSFLEFIKEYRAK